MRNFVAARKHTNTHGVRRTAYSNFASALAHIIIWINIIYMIMGVYDDGGRAVRFGAVRGYFVQKFILCKYEFTGPQQQRRQPAEAAPAAMAVARLDGGRAVHSVSCCVPRIWRDATQRCAAAP